MIEVKAKEDARTQLAENQIALAKAAAASQKKKDIVDQLDESKETKAQKQQAAETKKKAKVTTTLVPTKSLLRLPNYHNVDTCLITS